MAQSGFNQGHKTGILQGVKTGLGLPGLRSAYKGGIKETITNSDKMQDPAGLVGDKLPWIYANADETIFSAGSNLTLIRDTLDLKRKWLEYRNLPLASHPYFTATADIVGTYSRNGTPYTVKIGDTLAMGGNSGTTRPWPKIGGEDLGDHVYLDTGGSAGDSVSTRLGTIATTTTNGDIKLDLITPRPTAITIILVMKSKNIANKTHLWIEDNLSTGGLYFTQPTVDKLRLQWYNISGVSSTYESSNITQDLQDWMLVTMKCNLIQTLGPGSEQEFYINGKEQHQFVASNWANQVNNWSGTGQSFAINTDNVTSVTNGNSMLFASVLVLPYLANESEQLRLENYFRWYYGKRF